ncbi:hypothetical protein T459_17061 [Capsicum annuum]|uniref:Uncharacterized protein n=1 Tax=Capsicum annuum TaxID=4072 RepID=A0A2G2ZAL1_CAPAN|nr:hypothetical protein T459_17061 [Capsicum annuum]
MDNFSFDGSEHVNECCRYHISSALGASFDPNSTLNDILSIPLFNSNAYSLADYVIMLFGREGIDAKKGGSNEGIAGHLITYVCEDGSIVLNGPKAVMVKKPNTTLSGYVWDTGNTPPVDLQDHVASLKASSHQSEVKTNTVSPAMHPQSGLIKEVKTTITNVAPDSIQGATSKHLPPRTSGIQGTIVGSSIQEEWHITTGSRWDQKTEKNIDQSIQPTKSIDVKFLQQVAFDFEEVNGDQEGNTKLAKKAISMDSNLESTFQAICKKYGNIAKVCLLESGDILTSILKFICEVVLDLQKKYLSEVDRNLLDSYYLVVKDAEKLKVDVKWLRTRLDEIKDAISCIVEKNKINDERNKIAEQNEIEKKNLESKKAELKKLKSEIDRKEGQISMNTRLTEKLSSKIGDRALKIQQFQSMPLMEAFP